jgi:hypothetical protein
LSFSFATFGTGGTTSTSGANTIHKFTADGNFVLTYKGDVNILVVGGGGGGGASSVGQYAGGGGGGGLIFKIDYDLNVTTYKIQIGGGGTTSNNGKDTNFKIFNTDAYVLVGLGGGLGHSANQNGGNGGSGGAGQYNRSKGLAQQPASQWGGYGYDGGLGNNFYGGGGGGCGSAGGINYGGGGCAYSISGSSVTYSYGGNYWNGQTGTANPSPEPSNQGGGGIAGKNNGATGGSGIVIISYPTPKFIDLNVYENETSSHLTDVNIDCNINYLDTNLFSSPLRVAWDTNAVLSCAFSKTGYDTNTINLTFDTNKTQVVYLTASGGADPCSPTLNQDWNITSLISCTDKNINLGTGKLIINTGGQLKLYTSNVLAKSMQLNITGALIWLFSGSWLKFS